MEFEMRKEPGATPRRAKPRQESKKAREWLHKVLLKLECHGVIKRTPEHTKRTVWVVLVGG